SLSSVALSSAQTAVSLSDPPYFRQFVVLTLGSSITNALSHRATTREIRYHISLPRARRALNSRRCLRGRRGARLAARRRRPCQTRRVAVRTGHTSDRPRRSRFSECPSPKYRSRLHGQPDPGAPTAWTAPCPRFVCFRWYRLSPPLRCHPAEVRR